MNFNITIEEYTSIQPTSNSSKRGLPLTPSNNNLSSVTKKYKDEPKDSKKEVL